MSQVVQYRCAKCQRLLYKAEVGKDENEKTYANSIYKAEGLEYHKNKEGIMLLKCTKPGCETLNEMRNQRLVAV